MNIRDIIRSADGGGDPGEIALVVARKISADYTPGEVEDIYLPLVRSEVVRLRRHHARQSEDVAFHGSGGDNMAALLNVRDVPFTDVISHRMITWGQATRKQHRARARWLRESKIAPTVQTAERHETAAAICHARGVQRLNDLPEFGQAA